jgi:hypothetical protein
VVPSSDVWIVPSLLTLTSNPLEVVVEVLSLFAHEMIVKQKQKIRKTCKICFIFFPISKVKYYCLCIRRSQYIPRFGGVLQECRDFTWMVSDCEELVGLLTGDDGVGFRGLFLESDSIEIF